MLLNDGMRKEFLSGAAKDGVKAVKAFVKSNAENALKTKPKVREKLLLFVSLVVVVFEGVIAADECSRGLLFLLPLHYPPTLAPPSSE